MKNKKTISSTKQFVSIHFNSRPKLVRNDRMADKDYLVVPMVMLTEGVHEGSEGPYLYQASEMAKRVELWNKKPVVVYHPEEPSACTPEVLNTRWIGDIMNAAWDGKNNRITAEAWLDEARVKKVDNRILDAIQNEEVLELSTGLFAESDETPGTWNDEEYDGTLFNYGPDHLAVLPDQIGACSIEDGAGFYRNANGDKVGISKWWTQYFNELSQNTVRGQLEKLIAVKGEYRWVEDVYDDYFVYSTDNSLYKQTYEIDNDTVKLVGVPEPVVRVFDYQPVKNSGTKTSDKLPAKKAASIKQTMNKKCKEINTMNKQEMINALIANTATQWGEGDREMLEAMDEDMLKKLEPVQNEDHPKKQDNPEKKPEQVQNTQQKQMTDAEYLASLPPSIRNKWERMEKAEQSQKDKFIGIITTNKKNTFTKEYLNTKDVEELEHLAHLAEEKQEESNVVRFHNYGGQCDPVQNSDDTPNVEMVSPQYRNTMKKAEQKTA